MLWKILGGRCLYDASSGVRVFDNYFFRWLQLDSDALQTVLNKFYPQKAGLNYINALVFMARGTPGDCCMLGLGGAAIAHALSPYMANFKITAVEFNSEIIRLAPRFFMTDRLANLEIIHDEASAFVSHSSQSFQHIMVDLFNANSFPGSCNNEQFFADCKQRLCPGGTLAVNLANRHEQKPIFELIKKQFSGATVAIPIKNCANLIVVATKDCSITPLLNHFKNSKQLKQLAWDEIWGCVAELKT